MRTHSVVLILCMFGMTISNAQELPDPPEPVFIEESAPETSTDQVSDIDVPETLLIDDRTQCDISGISFEDITKGTVILRVYPAGRVKVTDGISFIKRMPYLILQPRAIGEFDLLFILHRGEKLIFIEKHFSVTE